MENVYTLYSNTRTATLSDYVVGIDKYLINQKNSIVIWNVILSLVDTINMSVWKNKLR